MSPIAGAAAESRRRSPAILHDVAHPDSAGRALQRRSITAVVNGHREGLQIRSAISSAELSLRRAVDVGWHGRLLVVLDKPDPNTHALVQSIGGLDLHVVEFADLGMSRNYAAECATTELIAFLDADDMWDPDWLAVAATRRSQHSEPHVQHPELVISFGAVVGQASQIPSTSPSFRREHLAFHNYWISQVVVDTDTLRDHPYPRMALNEGLGFEDWGWNCKTLAAGIPHEIVPGTMAFVRKRAGSLSISSLRAGVYPDYGGLFRIMA
jgi:hypothetical protein